MINNKVTDQETILPPIPNTKLFYRINKFHKNLSVIRVKEKTY